MLLAPSYSGTKVAAVIYGLATGIASFIGVVFASVGVLLAWFCDTTGWIKLGEYKPWLPIIFGQYSMAPGIVVGAIVCWRMWKSPLRRRGCCTA
jgi:hypothetical protein